MELTDPTAFARVYEQHAGSVYAAALRVTQDAAQAQDVVQDVFVRLWRKPSRFDARRGELGPYLRLMARSRALDLLREGQAAGRTRDRLVSVAGVEQQDRAGCDRGGPSDAAERSDIRGTVHAALRELPDLQREALVLAYWGGLTADEISRRTGAAVGTVKSRLRLGRARLRRELPTDVAQAAGPTAAWAA